MQPSLLDLAPRFDGATASEAEDGQRLRKHLARVLTLMSDGQWRTLAEVADAVGCSEAGASARLRDLRKPKMGGYTVISDRFAGGIWHYKVTL